MKFLHTADIHLKSKEDLPVLKVIIQTAKENSCDALLISGDMFDKESSILSTEQGLPQILEEFNGEIFIIPGNHDLSILSGRKSLSANSTVLNTDELVVKKKYQNIEIVAVPYKDEISLSKAGTIECDPDNSVMMAHGNYYTSEFFYSGDSKKYLPIFDGDLEDRYRYVALGHYHRFQKKQIGRTLVINPGSPCVTRASDLGPRVVSIVDTKTWKAQITELGVPYNEKLEILVSVFDSISTIQEKLQIQLKKIAGKKLQDLTISVTGTLSTEIEVANLHKILKEITGKTGNAAIIDTNSLSLIDGKIPENRFVQSLLEELEKSEASPEEKTRLKLFTLERLNTIMNG